MFGIPGLDPFGAVHAALGLAAIVLGVGVGLLGKGSRVHRRVGLVYALCLLLLNATALSIYDLFGRWGPFHNLAIVSLVTLLAGVLAVWLKRPRGRWMNLHGICMSWSYAGVVAALFSEIGARIPGVGLAAGVLIPSALVTAVAAVLIHTRVPRIVTGIMSGQAVMHSRAEEPFYG